MIELDPIWMTVTMVCLDVAFLIFHIRLHEPGEPRDMPFTDGLKGY
jgi:hypothetical protein